MMRSMGSINKDTYLGPRNARLCLLLSAGSLPTSGDLEPANEIGLRRRRRCCRSCFRLLPVFFVLSAADMSRALRSFLERSRSAHPPCLAATSLAASFHSTPVLERKRRTQWHSRFNYYAKRNRKNESRRTLVRNLSDYAEYLFESWRNEDNDNSSREDPTWFRRHYWSTGSKRNGFHEMPRGNFKNRRNMTFDFCTSDEEEVDTIFQAAFRGSRFTYWSFDDSESSHWSSSGHKFHKGSRNWEYESDDETYTSSKMDLGSERRALGLSSSGPLKLEDVKSAYRECALRWHPDRHQGSSKVIAEEKFKHCSAAYKTLCDSLA